MQEITNPELREARFSDFDEKENERAESSPAVFGESCTIPKLRFDKNDQPLPTEAVEYLNEDSSLVDEKLRLMIVADGVGSSGSASDASHEAIQVIVQQLSGSNEGNEGTTKPLSECKTPAEAAQLITAALERAHLLQATTNIGYGNEDQFGATTAVITHIQEQDGKRTAIIGSVGDSRTYSFNHKSGLLRCLTLDDNLARQEVPEKVKDFYEVQYAATHPEFLDFDNFPEEHKKLIAYQIKNRLISLQENIDNIIDIEEEINLDENAFETKYGAVLTPEDIKNYFQKSNTITQGIGKVITKGSPESSTWKVAPLKVRTITHELEADEILFTCSDGVSDNLTFAELQALFVKFRRLSPTQLTREIVAAAQRKDRKPDDITGIAWG